MCGVPDERLCNLDRDRGQLFSSIVVTQSTSIGGLSAEALGMFVWYSSDAKNLIRGKYEENVINFSRVNFRISLK